MILQERELCVITNCTSEYIEKKDKQTSESLAN